MLNKSDTHGSLGKGYIAVDLDGTLAHYDGWKGYEHIGKPIPAMLERVKEWIDKGKEVHILTARAAPIRDGTKGYARRIDPIKQWLKRNVGKELPITYKKDSEMLELWDDRAVQVEPNTGQRVDGEKSMTGIEELEEFAKGGPYIGPRGGKYADPGHKIPWKDDKGKPDPKALDKLKPKKLGGEINPIRSSQEKKDWSQPVRNKWDSKFGQAKVTQRWTWSGGEAVIGTTSDGKDVAVVYDNKKAISIGPNDNLSMASIIKQQGKNLGRVFHDTTKSMEANMTGIEELEEFVKGGSGGLPTGKPTMGGSGEEQGGNLAGVGKTSGSGDSSSGEPVGAPAPKKEKLSKDDQEDENQMKPHKKPIETRKSLTPTGQREQVAHEHAVKVAELRKGEEDIQAGVGVAPPQPEKPQLEKGRVWDQGADACVQYSSQADLDATRLLKSDDFYITGSPSMSLKPMLSEYKTCVACKSSMSKSLSACPSCGHGSVQHRILPGTYIGDDVKLSKSIQNGPVLRPSIERDVALPNGLKSDSE